MQIFGNGIQNNGRHSVLTPLKVWEPPARTTPDGLLNDVSVQMLDCFSRGKCEKVKISTAELLLPPPPLPRLRLEGRGHTCHWGWVKCGSFWKSSAAGRAEGASCTATFTAEKEDVTTQQRTHFVIYSFGVYQMNIMRKILLGEAHKTTSAKCHILDWQVTDPPAKR